MVKVISLSEEAYRQLSKIKGNRSFSETILGLIENKKKPDISEFAGVLKDRAQEWETIKNNLAKERKNFKLGDN